MKREKTVIDVEVSEEKQKEIVSSLLREHTNVGMKFERERTRQEEMVRPFNFRGFLFEEKSGREITWGHRFRNVFRPHENGNSAFWNSFGLKSVFEKLSGPNPRNKAAFPFLHFFGVLWTLPWPHSAALLLVFVISKKKTSIRRKITFCLYSYFSLSEQYPMYRRNYLIVLCSFCVF